MEPFDPNVVGAAYDTVAGDYVRVFGDDLERLPLDRSVLDDFAAGLAPSQIVLDVGCGPAQVGAYLTDRGLRVVGVDLALQMLRLALQRSPAVRLTCGDLRELPFRPHSFAGVVAFYSIHHLQREELPEGLAEIRRVLSTGGRLLIATHLGEGEKYTEEFLGHRIASVGGTMYREPELRAALERQSFAIENIQTRHPLDNEYPSQRIYLTARMDS
jgi:ubiquinone/menaquinone biosynthesis C-methylase UbiE